MERTYHFFVPLIKPGDELAAYTSIYEYAEGRGKSGKTKLDRVQILKVANGLQCTVTTASAVFSEWLIQNGYLQEMIDHSTHVKADRSSNPHKDPTIII